MPESANPSAFRFAHPSNRFSKTKSAPIAQDGFHGRDDSRPRTTSRVEEHGRPLTGKPPRFKTINRAESVFSNGLKRTSPSRVGHEEVRQDAAGSSEEARSEDEEMLLGTSAAISELPTTSTTEPRCPEGIQHHPTKRRRTEDYQTSSSSPLAHRLRASSGSPARGRTEESPPIRQPGSALKPPLHRGREESTPEPQAPPFKSAPRFSYAPTSNFWPIQRTRRADPETAPTPDITRPRFAAPAKSRLGSLANPLPDAFSPHKNRRGQERYVPGGWASQVRGWIFDTSNEAAEAEASKADVIRVEQVHLSRGSGGQGNLMIIRGLVIDPGGAGQPFDRSTASLNKHLDVLLVGDGAPTGHNSLARDRATFETPGAGAQDDADSVRVGSRIKLGPPCWEMPLAQIVSCSSNVDVANSTAHGPEKTWLVCAGWKIVNR